MRLYIDDNGKKVYLRQRATTRHELTKILGAHQFQANGKIYKVSSVRAEPDDTVAPLGMGIGGALGVLGGIPGIIAGAVIGAAVGGVQLEKDRKMAEAFNESR